MATRGLTNREVAATLFPSPKTVAYHLRHAYQKLDVRSLTDLRRTMSPVRSPTIDCVAAPDGDGRVEVVAERWFGCAQRASPCLRGVV
jgi:DNA-binding NarL/FixJ family response regulator